MIYAQANELLLLNGDCIELMKAMPDNCVDSIVTDPPYGISFMGKAWDNARMLARGIQGLDHNKDNRRSANQHAGTYDTSYSAGLSFQQFSCAWAVEALRVLKPGGHLLSFSSSRTYHRMTSGIEDAGFEIRDQIMWLYGSGFPKSLNIDKAINKAAGVERDVIGSRKAHDIRNNNLMEATQGLNRGTMVYEYTAPATDLAKKWLGWGTALKPAHEPIVVARKPLIGTVVENVLTHGTGGINIDGTRVGTDQELGRPQGTMPQPMDWGNKSNKEVFISTGSPLGRWPANVIHDGSDEVVELFPDTKKGNFPATQNTASTMMASKGKDLSEPKSMNDSGSAARFFYCAKTSKHDRNEGCENLEDKEWKAEGAAIPERENRPFLPSKNNHPTVKPTELMRYLVRLVTPPNGIVLDPFTGSGSTGKACMLEDFNFIGIDLSEEYLEIAKARIAFALENKSYELFK